MISEYDKVHTERGLRIVSSEHPKKLGLENTVYLKNPEKGKSTCFIVYPDYPQPARFCIEDLSRKFFTCIGLFEPVYYFHDIYQGVLDKDQKEKLNEYLHGKDKYGNMYNRWRHLVDAWEVAMGENDILVPDHIIESPDYTLLPDIEPDHPAMFNLQIKYK